jgi:uncharacterized protein (TIGR03083 family)
MTARTFAPWVEPIATALAEGRREVVDYARSLPAEVWDTPSDVEGWTCKDVLSHLAGDTGKITTSAISGPITGVAPVSTFDDGGDAANARDISERRERTIDELLAEIEGDGRCWQELLGQLGDAEEDATWPSFPMSLGTYLGLEATHDREHLEQIRRALEASR